MTMKIANNAYVRSRQKKNKVLKAFASTFIHLNSIFVFMVDYYEFIIMFLYVTNIVMNFIIMY